MAHQQHHHAHGSNHGHHGSVTSHNKAFWDENASKYTEKQWQKDIVNKVTQDVRANIEWIDPKLVKANQDQQYRVLDYACGPGTITNALKDSGAEFQGVDLSDKMVEIYNHRFKEEAPDLKAKAVAANLLDAEQIDLLPEEEYFNFDLVVVGLGFHHFENLQLSTDRLVERLKPGGTLLIIDLVTHSKEDHPAAHTVTHHGFGQEQVQTIFEAAGLSEFGHRELEGEIKIAGVNPRTIFLAKGQKGI